MLTQTNNSLQNLKNSLSDEKQAFMDLFELLQLERTALEAGKIEAIKDFSIKKQKITQAIEEFALLRNKALSNSDVLLNQHNSIAEAIKVLPKNLQQLWQQVIELAEDCHQCNQVNGKIIQISKGRVDRSLRLLKSQTADPGLTYNSAGIASLSTNPLRTVKA